MSQSARCPWPLTTATETGSCIACKRMGHNAKRRSGHNICRHVWLICSRRCHFDSMHWRRVLDKHDQKTHSLMYFRIMLQALRARAVIDNDKTASQHQPACAYTASGAIDVVN